MTFGQAIRTGFRRALTFSARASRTEFWYFMLFFCLGFVATTNIDATLYPATDDIPVTSVFMIIVGVPLFTAAWRRMHDTGRSGLYVLYPFIVMVGLTTFMGVMAGVAPSHPGAALSDLREAATALGIAVTMIAAFVFMISPLLVIWWLARPSQPGQNQWGWPPV